ncbi:MAG: ABC transporter permease [Lachnospiraceae bacterium]
MKFRKKHKDTLPMLSMVGPISVWLMAFLALPLLYVIAISFMNKGAYGGVELGFTLKNYADILNPTYAKVAWKSLLLAFNTSWICLLIGYPFAYFISKMSSRTKGIVLLLIMLPFWTNGLIRLNGWTNVLRDSGFVNTLLLKIGIIDTPITMMYTNGAILFGMVYTFIPFMILPLQTSISKLDPALTEAAQDLGAKKIRTFLRVTLPLTVPGIFAGTIMVFIPTLGAYYISDIMGGGNSTLLGNLIKNQFMVARNWPSGAAFSVMLIVFTLLALKIYTMLGDVEDLR